MPEAICLPACPCSFTYPALFLLLLLLLLLQDLYVALPVPEPLRSGENAGSFAFLEKELRFSQM